MEGWELGTINQEGCMEGEWKGGKDKDRKSQFSCAHSLLERGEMHSRLPGGSPRGKVEDCKSSGGKTMGGPTCLTTLAQCCACLALALSIFSFLSVDSKGRLPPPVSIRNYAEEKEEEEEEERDRVFEVFKGSVWDFVSRAKGGR